MGMDFKFKSATSLFRKLMSRLDASISACSESNTQPPTPADVLKSILDILRYTAVFSTKLYTPLYTPVVHTCALWEKLLVSGP
jgi:hypothetical protein